MPKAAAMAVPNTAVQIHFVHRDCMPGTAAAPLLRKILPPLPESPTVTCTAAVTSTSIDTAVALTVVAAICHKKRPLRRDGS